MLDKKIHLVGCGPGSREYLTSMAVDVVKNSEVVIGPQKFAELFQPISGRLIITGKKIRLILDHVQDHFSHKSIAVLLRGDPGCFSLSRLVIDRFGISNCRVIPGISSVQLALSRLGLDWTGARVISVHGRNPDRAARDIFTPELCVILLGNDLTWLVPVLEQAPENRTIYLMQDLGLQGESISTINSAQDLDQNISPSSLLVIDQE